MSVALFSQAKKSEYGIAQPSSCIVGYNILNKRYVRTMFDNSIVHETSPEANWNRRTGRQADAQDNILSQADTLTENKTLFLGFDTIEINQKQLISKVSSKMQNTILLLCSYYFYPTSQLTRLVTTIADRFAKDKSYK